jgi:hypothetical protein
MRHRADAADRALAPPPPKRLSRYLHEELGTRALEVPIGDALEALALGALLGALAALLPARRAARMEVPTRRRACGFEAPSFGHAATQRARTENLETFPENGSALLDCARVMRSWVAARPKPAPRSRV